ncbi:hypothetical protein [Pseudomonas monteilii]|uniref:hypothetical protein n=1 Tax=Pseudomonas monteilii TaxID=76759 RepID=UPI001E5F27F6|nr:hypothetical protein [Pseudomonas monteilii]MCE0931633.1 hypothetical protein [Pseudomonas monteilii]MCE1009189.1 hypothetical protein [Pseudomonas monteilii]WJN90209.1 hypothetical protein LU680_09970 [Pseudomonas monteilii]WJO34821.1 hypothetical protein LU690_08645 [Pseudomonas monteilii]WJR41166.1 hypothetical protein LU662_009220 [Pseudomonas monteilii]
MSELIQPSFSAGEVAPATYARVDLARYYTALKTCRNFVVLPEGGAQNRSGTRFITEVKDSSARTRLIPFQFSTEQTYILEFGNLYIRFISMGGQVVSGVTPYEIASPYTTAQLPDLKFTQSADVMTIVHPAHPPRELSRLAPTNWTLTAITFEPGIAAPTGLVATARVGGSGDTTEYQYKVTAVSGISEGSVESWASNTATVNSFDDKPGATLAWTAVAGADHYNVYKNKSSGVFGFIGQSAGVTFNDINITPETDNTVPIGYNPFADGNNPSVVGYYQQRMAFAASTANPQTVWMSRTGDFHNFGYSDPNKDDDGIEFVIASRQVNQIRHLVSLRELLAMTSGAEIAITGSSDSGITPANVSAVEQSYFGTSDVIPAIYANTALYIQARGGKLSTLAYNYVSDGFQPQDVSVLSSHLLRGFTIQDQAFALAPNGVLWMVRNDGMLLGFTFLPDQQVYGWSWHDTDGKVEAVASVPEDDEDALYLIVNRTINGVTKRYIERMASRQLTKFGTADYWFDRSFFVDCGLTYDGRLTGTAVLTGGTDWKYPNLLTLTVGVATFNVGMVGRYVVMHGGGTETDSGDRVVVRITGYGSPTAVTVEPQTIVPESLRGISATRWGLAATVVSSLNHLEGKTVSILGDGNVVPQRVVTGGSITLDNPTLVAHVGLPITGDFETLDITLQNNQAFLGAKKRINQLVVLCQESRGIFAGPDADHLDELKQRAGENYGEPIDLLTGRAEMEIPCNWDSEGRLFIRQSDPLPLTILGVMPNVQSGG